jgi:mannose-6-phosphate isomerase-like protein (cupin superfamily)
MERLDPRSEAAARDQFWSQKVIGEANGNLFKVAKGIGETNWHAHDDQDEVFLILEGTMTMGLRTGDIELAAGDMLIVPRGVEHRPRADSEVRFMLVGPEITSTAAGGKPDWSFDTPAS